MTWDITGLGAVASVGGNPDEIFESLCTGRDGLAGLRAFDRSRYRMRNAYEIDDRATAAPSGPDGPRSVDEPGRATRWLRSAIQQALTEAGLDSGPDALRDVPVLVGTTLREQRGVELWWREGMPLELPDLHFGTALRAEFAAPRTFTFANACAAALYALGLASDLIELGAAETVVVAGTDAITESAFGTLDRVQNQTPDALRPFDRSHRGMVMGEGAAAVVLQRTGPERRVQARLRSVAMNCDAYHPTAPDPDGIKRVIGDAYRRAGLTAADIHLVMLHGTGTPKNDEVEAAVLHEIFALADAPPLMTAIKSMTGHTLGGSGLLSLIVAVLACQRGLVPPVRWLVDPIDEAAGLRLVRDKAEPAELAIAQVDSFGFGGLNAVAILEAGR